MNSNLFDSVMYQNTEIVTLMGFGLYFDNFKLLYEGFYVDGECLN